MTLQDTVWWLSLAGMTGVALVFAYVIGQAGTAGRPAELQARAHANRRRFFVALIVLGIGVTGATLVPFPIPPQRDSSAVPSRREGRGPPVGLGAGSRDYPGG